MKSHNLVRIFVKDGVEGIEVLSQYDLWELEEAYSVRDEMQADSDKPLSEVRYAVRPAEPEE